VRTENVIIAGGGVSGLATAYYLGKLGLASTLIEKSNRLGGLVKTDLIRGCRLEAGPDSYLAAKFSVTEIAGELDDLSSQIIGSNDAARRIFVVRGGKLVPMPAGMVMMVPGLWMPLLRSELLGAKSKLRFLAEVFARPRTRAEEVSVGELVQDHFGNEVLEYVAEPLLAGVYGGDSVNLSADSVLPRFAAYERAYGSLIRAIRRERRGNSQQPSLFLSFQDGMQTFTDALARAIASSTKVVHAEVNRVERSESSWHVKVGDEWLSSGRVVLACPAHACTRLLENSAPALAGELAGIPCSSAILVTLVYERSKFRHPLNGFGFLVPRPERRVVAAATWVNTKFPSRIPLDLSALRAFIVGEDTVNLLGAPNEDLVRIVRAEYQRLMGIEVEPLFSTVYSWPQSMPQYVLGHKRRQQRINQALQECPGLYIVNNAVDGVGIPDCVRLAKETAKQIASGK
jgi:protoporphyrinogen/coproporphyrinogen III oxidase